MLLPLSLVVIIAKLKYITFAPSAPRFNYSLIANKKKDTKEREANSMYPFNKSSKY